jgi:hypothetical protein
MILKLIKSFKSPVIGDLVIDYSDNIGICLQSCLKVGFNVRYDDGVYFRYFKEAEQENCLKIKSVIKPYGISNEPTNVGDKVWIPDKVNGGRVVTLDSWDEDDMMYKFDGNKNKCTLYLPKKVVILPEQFNYQDIVDLGLKDGDEFDAKFTEEWVPYDIDSLGSVRKYLKKTVSITKPTPITYTKEEITNNLEIFDSSGKPLHIGDVICSFILSKAKELNVDAEVIAVGIDTFAKTIDIHSLEPNAYDATNAEVIDSKMRFNPDLLK